MVIRIVINLLKCIHNTGNNIYLIFNKAYNGIDDYIIYKYF